MQGVHKRFGKTHAVRDLDLSLPRGSLTGFLGPNGAGKSTTIRMIMSILHPDQGEVRVLGGDARAHKDRIGYLPETRGLYPKMRVGEYLAYIARLNGAQRRDLRAHALGWLERLGLAEEERERCRALSKGMQQKVQIIAALIHEPDLLILDEPFTGLDPVNVQQLSDLVSGLRDSGVTILFSTHVLHQAEVLCDRIVLIDHGQKLLDGTVAEIRDRFDPRTLDVELLESTLRPPPGVLRVDQTGPRRFELHLAADADRQAVARAVMEGHSIRSVALRQLSLQEVFVQLVTAKPAT